MYKTLTIWIRAFPIALLLQSSPSYANASYFCSDVFEASHEAIRFTSMAGAADSHGQHLVRQELLVRMKAHENQLIKELEKMSQSELIAATSFSIDTLLNMDGYLPGCSPSWTARSSEELIANFQQSKKDQSMLHMIVKNLAAIETISAQVKETSGLLDQEELFLVEIWESNIFHYHVFKTLEHWLQTTKATFLEP